MTRKLIRDRIPDAIRANGYKPIITVADPADMLDLLAAKLCEETAEFCDTYDPAELIDVLEVVYALTAIFGGNPQLLERMREAALETRGGFSQRLIWHGNQESTA
jgi:predicted house-cleaning noncanonical NTP pyrophosphatase (MazG superfamily)